MSESYYMAVLVAFYAFAAGLFFAITNTPAQQAFAAWVLYGLGFVVGFILLVTYVGAWYVYLRYFYNAPDPAPLRMRHLYGGFMI